MVNVFRLLCGSNMYMHIHILLMLLFFSLLLLFLISFATSFYRNQNTFWTNKKTQKRIVCVCSQECSRFNSTGSHNMLFFFFFFSTSSFVFVSTSCIRASRSWFIFIFILFNNIGNYSTSSLSRFHIHIRLLHTRPYQYEKYS